ncbi:phosphoribosyltransferase [Aquimarina sp. 2-A2]|uniref:phosphoribosyltransferase n=1 Tax=Aquimarina sp. 2-A2 TaxID=3382644 RepID=UPI00387F1EAD
MIFKNRREAGIQLAAHLEHLKDKNTIVLAIPRGGLPLGAIVAKTLDAPLDVVLTKKIGHPKNKEFAIGAVSLNELSIIDSYEVSQEYIKQEIQKIRKKLQRRYYQYYKNLKPLSLEQKIVIIVDDGIATGNTMMATIKLVHNQKPHSIVVAVPVAPTSVVKKLNSSPFVQEVICLQASDKFYAVGQFYKEFSTVTDEMAIRILEESNKDKIH